PPSPQPSTERKERPRPQEGINPQIRAERRNKYCLCLIVGSQQWLRIDQHGSEERRATSRGDVLELGDDVGQLRSLPASNRGFAQVEEPRPAHESMERGVRDIEDGPKVTQRLFVPPVPDGSRATREMRGCQQWATLYRLEGPLGLRHHRLEILLCSAKRGYQRGDQLTREPVLRLSAVARQTGALGRSRRGQVPLAGVYCRPREVNRCLSERTEPDLLAQPLDGA